jgi:hypothetical protein
MRKASLGRDWTADSARADVALRAALEVRLAAMSAPRRRACPLRLQLTAALLALAALFPWSVTAAVPEPSSLAEQWEDVLLLDAVQYLRLSAQQLQQIEVVADELSLRLRALEEKEAATRVRLEEIARRQREALVSGAPASLADQDDALRAEREMRDARAETVREIGEIGAARLARILRPDQVRKAYLLAHGQLPPETARRPALLDPQSGFVVDLAALCEVTDAPLRELLAKRYPAQRLDAVLLPSLTLTSHWGIETAVDDATFLSRVSLDVTGTVPDPHATELFVTDRDRTKRTKVVDRLIGFSTKNDGLSTWMRAPSPSPGVDAQGVWRLLGSGATEAELAASLRPLARRLFTSPRCKPVLNERLRTSGLSGPTEERD